MNTYRVAKGGAALALTAVVGTWWYRPTGSMHKDGPKRLGFPFMSLENVHDEASELPFFVGMFRGIVTPPVVMFWNVVMRYSPLGGQVRITRDDNYEAFLAAVARRESGRPLITVANHRSLLDDPGLMCNLLPIHLGIQPKFLRWATCAQEVCFSENLPSVVSAFFLAGQSLPIWRGGGINQRHWLDFARHVANGDWCHVFPEAGIWQIPAGTLGGRGSRGEEMVYKTGLSKEIAGKLKWGVGKLIAHSPMTPLVVPFYHNGMEQMLEQDDKTRKLKRPLQEVRSIGGKGVSVKFGVALDFSDLIEEHEKREGPLWKFHNSAKADSMQYILKNGGMSTLNSDPGINNDSQNKDKGNEDKIIKESVGAENKAKAERVRLDDQGNVDFHRYWDSTAQEQLLYHKITRRIEDALEQLNPQAQAQTQIQAQSQTHVSQNSPKV